MDLLHENGIAVDLATATATPPPWLSAAHPEILPVDHDGPHPVAGQPPGAGARARRSTATTPLALTTQLAQRYHDHPALAMWHVSNEYACHNIPCYCDTCAARLPGLAARAATATSRRSTTRGARPSGASATPTGSRSCRRAARTTFANPTHQLDYTRFQSDTLLDFHRSEKAVLSELSPGVPVTTNFMTMTHFGQLDYHQWAPEQDVVSTDHYVVDALEHPRAELAFSGDLTRGLAGGAPVDAHGALDQCRQLAAGQPRQGPRPDDPRQPRPRGTRCRHHRLLPVAPVARRGRRSSTPPWSPTPAATARGSARCASSAPCAHGSARSSAARVEAEVAILWDYQASWAADRPGHALDDLLPHDRPRRPPRCCATAGVTGGRRAPRAPTSRHTGSSSSPRSTCVTDDARRGHRCGGRGRRRPGARHLLLRHQRRARPRPARRLPGSVPRPARRARRGVLPPRPARRSRSARGRRAPLWSEDLTAGGRRGPRPVCRRPARGRPGRHARAPPATGPRGTSHAPRRRHPRGAARRAIVDAAGSRPAAAVPVGVEAVRRTQRRGVVAVPRQPHRRTAARRRQRPRPGHRRRRSARRSPLAPGGVAVVRED